MSLAIKNTLVAYKKTSRQRTKLTGNIGIEAIDVKGSGKENARGTHFGHDAENAAGRGMGPENGRAAGEAKDDVIEQKHERAGKRRALQVLAGPATEAIGWS